MAVPATLLNRLKDLEYSFDIEGRGIIKTFIYHHEEDVPFWDPEPPKA